MMQPSRLADEGVKIIQVVSRGQSEVHHHLGQGVHGTIVVQHVAIVEHIADKDHKEVDALGNPLWWQWVSPQAVLSPHKLAESSS